MGATERTRRKTSGAAAVRATVPVCDATKAPIRFPGWHPKNFFDNKDNRSGYKDRQCKYDGFAHCCSLKYSGNMIYLKLPFTLATNHSLHNFYT
jgi:hypothetical protein